MGFIPMQFSTEDNAVREPDQRHSFELSPTASAKPGLETHSLANGEINGYRLDVCDITAELEILPHDGRV